MVAFVQNKDGQPLMPCHPAKARRLMREGKAKMINRTTFTIRLIHGSTGYKQPVTLGVDSGYLHVGLSAVSGKRELYAADVTLRKDIVELNSERRQYRRARRGRKTWYRQPRFDNRKKPSGWLAPSIQHKLDSQVKLVQQVTALLPISKVVVEVAAFDIQKIKNPDIAEAEYQHGEQLGCANVREYVLHRDGHRCVHCKGKSKAPVLEVHHLESRKTGGDRPDNLVTLCLTCHELVTAGKITLKVRVTNGFKAETFMTMVRWKLVDTLKEIGYEVQHTYGYLTKVGRQALGQAKSHVDDAFVIAGGQRQARTAALAFRQVRKCNRKLRKGDRSHLVNTAPREVHGFQRFDKVNFKGTECFVFGRRTKGYFDLRMLDGTKVHASAKASTLRLLERAKSFICERIGAPLGNQLPSIRAQGIS